MDRQFVSPFLRILVFVAIDSMLVLLILPQLHLVGWVLTYSDWGVPIQEVRLAVACTLHLIFSAIRRSEANPGLGFECFPLLGR